MALGLLNVFAARKLCGSLLHSHTTILSIAEALKYVLLSNSALVASTLIVLLFGCSPSSLQSAPLHLGQVGVLGTSPWGRGGRKRLYLTLWLPSESYLFRQRGIDLETSRRCEFETLHAPLLRTLMVFSDIHNSQRMATRSGDTHSAVPFWVSQTDVYGRR